MPLSELGQLTELPIGLLYDENMITSFTEAKINSLRNSFGNTKHSNRFQKTFGG